MHQHQLSLEKFTVRLIWFHVAVIQIRRLVYVEHQPVISSEILQVSEQLPRDPTHNFQNCWCKMTAIGVPGAGDTPDQRYANGTIMSVSGGWVFVNARTAAADCARNCVGNCAGNVRAYPAFRRNVLTVR